MLETLLDTATADLGVLLQAIAAVLFGGLIGLEREASHKGAGLRTHLLVCLAALLFTRLGVFMTEFSAEALPDLVEADPVRILQAIVIGVSFLGAGVILRDPAEARVHGLTTAATLLIVAPIGVAVGLGRYVLAAGVTGIVLIALRLGSRFEDRFFPNDA